MFPLPFVDFPGPLLGAILFLALLYLQMRRPLRRQRFGAWTRIFRNLVLAAARTRFAAFNSHSDSLLRGDVDAGSRRRHFELVAFALLDSSHGGARSCSITRIIGGT